MVVGTALRCVAAAATENTVPWHEERFWGASEDFWESRWRETIHALCGGDGFLKNVSGELQETFGKAVGRKSMLFMVEMNSC